MQGLNEALQTIQRTAVAAEHPKTIDVGSPYKVGYLIGERVEVYDKALPPREHVVYDLDSLRAWCDERSPVWHNDDRVVVVLDDEAYRVSTVAMPLPLHPTFGALCQAPERVDQALLIRWLRLHLKETLEKDYPTLIATMREIRIRQNVAGQGTVEHGRESMGKTIDNSVTGADAIPEEVLLNVPIWLHHEARVQVRCYFDIDVQAVKFTFAPMPGELEHARQAAQAWLHEQLEALAPESTVYFGSPTVRYGDFDD